MGAFRNSGRDTGVRKGRGAVSNRDGRLESHRHVALDDGWEPFEAPDAAPRTSVTIDRSKSVISRNRSPDVPFDISVNPYRGCEHGCVYCFARPNHAFLGWSPGLDFETRLVAKPDAAKLLAGEIGRRGYRCSVLALGTNTDPYQPIERHYRITRGILEVLAARRHPVSITTKSSLVERDVDLLAPMAAQDLASVNISITTLDHGLARRLEPRATAPRRRLEVVRRLTAAGVPVQVSVAPVIPVLTDAELESIVAAAAEAGAVSASYILLRLPLEVKDLFQEWLAANVPAKAEHVMSVMRQSRNGKENDSRFGVRKRGCGVFADLLGARFRLAVKRHGLDASPPALSTALFRNGASAGEQISLV